MRIPAQPAPHAIQPPQELEFAFPEEPCARPARIGHLAQELAAFHEFGKPTRILRTAYPGAGGALSEVPTFVNEFWTSKQRAANRLHEISYRACFKPQLPRFFIERLIPSQPK